MLKTNSSISSILVEPNHLVVELESPPMIPAAENSEHLDWIEDTVNRLRMEAGA